MYLFDLCTILNGESRIYSIGGGGARILVSTFIFQMLRTCLSHDVTIETNIRRVGKARLGKVRKQVGNQLHYAEFT